MSEPTKAPPMADHMNITSTYDSEKYVLVNKQQLVFNVESNKRLREELTAEREKVAKLEGLVESLKDSLHRDKTGLASALSSIKELIIGYSWIKEGRGPYEWDDNEYKTEFKRMADHILRITEHSLKASGDLVHPICCKGQAPNLPRYFSEEQVNEMLKELLEKIDNAPEELSAENEWGIKYHDLDDKFELYKEQVKKLVDAAGQYLQETGTIHGNSSEESIKHCKKLMVSREAFHLSLSAFTKETKEPSEN